MDLQYCTIRLLAPISIFSFQDPLKLLAVKSVGCSSVNDLLQVVHPSRRVLHMNIDLAMWKKLLELLWTVRGEGLRGRGGECAKEGEAEGTAARGQ